MIVDYEETLVKFDYTAIPVCTDELSSRCCILEKPIPLANVTPGQQFVACAFMPPRRSELTVLAMEQNLVASVALIDHSAVIASTSSIGRGSFVNTCATIGGLATIGQHAVINRNASIGHHVLIDDFVSIGPSATVAGGVSIGEGAMLGAGCTILPGVSIGENSIVAAGAVVTAPVDDNTMVAGNPAKTKKTGDVFAGICVPGEE